MVINLRVESHAKRADLYISEQICVSRTQVKNLIETGNILLNNKIFKPSVALIAGDLIAGNMPESIRDETLAPLAIKLDILYEDEHMIIINKEKGIVVHPAHGHKDDTLVNALIYHCKDLKGIGGILRPGVVHRLDKDTAGVMVFAKDEKSCYEFQRQFREREVVKKYLVLVLGTPAKSEDTIVTMVGRSKKDRKKFAVTLEGREAVTQYRVLKSFGGLSLVEVIIKTGRTHQIRVHMEYIGHPVVGDICYNRKNYKQYIKNPKLLEIATSIKGQALCASFLEITHPENHKKMGFKGKIPEDMQKIINWMDLHGTD
jgi:23S rRNA pseudouridine1911/1915/1917 synthase